MLLFCEFDRLRWGHHIGVHEPAGQLARVPDEFPTVELVVVSADHGFSKPKEFSCAS